MVIAYKKIIIGTLISIVFLFITAVIVFFRFYEFHQAYGSSMSPALKEDEVYLVRKKVDHFQRGDIVVFEHPKEGYFFVKRVIGFPDEEVEIKDNYVYINGQRLQEPYLAEEQSIKDFQPVRVPSEHFFMLGDDRVNSYDSRDFGMIKISWVEGKVVKE